MVQGSGGLADMAVDRGSKVMPGIPIGGNMMAGAARRFAGGDKVMSAVPVEKTVSPESEAAMGINKEWRERRRREAIRRQSAGLEGSDHEKRVGFLCRTFMHLRQHLPLVALPALTDAVALLEAAPFAEAAAAHEQQVAGREQRAARPPSIGARALELILHRAGAQAAEARRRDKGEVKG